MVIEKLEIKGFGKINGLVLKLGSGLNVIYGENEAGKSSVRWFIKAMFYGLRGGRALKDEVMPPLKRFKPWKGDDYGGSMEYRLDSGESYRVERDFNSNTVRIFDGLFNDVTHSFEPDRESGVKFAEKHLGMNGSCFERTVFIGQAASVIDEEGSRELLNRLINISQTGFEEVSFRKAEKALKDALKNYVGTGRTTSRPLDKVEERLEELKLYREKLIESKRNLEKAQRELNEALAEKAGLERKKQALTMLKELIDIRNRTENLKRQKIVLEEALEKICDEERELEKVKESLSKPAEAESPHAKKHGMRSVKYGLVVLLAAAAIATAVGIGDDKPVFAAAAAAVASLTAIALVLGKGGALPGSKSGRKNFPASTSFPASTAGYEAMVRETLRLSNSIKDRLNRCSLACGEQIGSTGDISRVLNRIESESKSLKARFHEKKAEMLAVCGDEAEALEEAYRLKEDMPASELLRLEVLWEKDYSRVNGDLSEALLKVRECETVLKNQAFEGEELQKVEEEIAELMARKKQLEDIHFSLATALDVLTQARLELERDFVPALNGKLCEIIYDMTNGKYSDLKADGNLSLKVIAPETQTVTDVMLLSGGTVDQVYFALRLAAAELFEGEDRKLPLVMDETFAQYDDTRTREAFRLLKNRYPDRQIILLTCKTREVDIAREIFGDRLNLIYL